jgi:NAD(P)-dependent dehydrogenase (short-subunit alcohol dehydrogenase family)
MDLTQYESRPKGTRALVTGSAAGIGLAIATALAKEQVIVNVRTQKRGDEAMAASGATQGIAADLGTAEGAAVIAYFPAVDILVNNVGIFEPKPFDQIPNADWQRFFHVNLMSGVRLNRHCLSPMKQKNWGRARRSMDRPCVRMAASSDPSANSQQAFPPDQ